MADKYQLKAVTVIAFSTPEEVATALTNEKTRKNWDLNLNIMNRIGSDAFKLVYFKN